MGSELVSLHMTSFTIKTGKLSQLEEEYLDKLVLKSLPVNYNFELRKCVYRIRKDNYCCVALQMPEGLLAWAPEISEILQFFCPTLKEVIIMADVTYGACCIDDYTAKNLGCDLLIHYGHSCLVPVTEVGVNCLYIFVEITFSSQKLSNAIESSFKPDEHIIMMGTIQYSNVIREAVNIINKGGYFKYLIDVPQVSPLLPGEVLGCTSPIIDQNNLKVNENHKAESSVHDRAEVSHIIIFVADGRFHLESTLIQNPGIKLYRFDPFNKIFSEEAYDLDTLHSVRKKAILKATEARSVCIILSTLGRQGNVNILNNICSLLSERNIKHVKLLLSEITIDKILNLNVDCSIQIGCPRLSIDWGDSFPKPLLNPYEAYVAFKSIDYRQVYPMDYYSKSGGEWSNYTTNAKCCDKSNVRDAIRQRLLQRSLMARSIGYSK
ncbi:Diphthamide synthesis protein [Theileria orientalis strain Shintoku]|uniref:2-(3-amino-3-carboxypropyl)histidine synthase subunit 1 n=1 Tax=Theileria orientalis strain Shintoku TaxID=869250 RepID=J4C834_THEOR|nr:Diphthamide synthesis protein [Theileria orientalis strain Shintoku]PVC51093.1 Diphthamide synthesis protein [Theileria orientalis]BAM40093.1 Diphthamide synthesis protein [Theileria orientalis strain Shintoku]|eukprot:XP_009690394.1 Diphthamide synthesis protein [Theileria orientalis strain Shintoku]